jgi:organic radical activating enzyme
MLTRTRAAVAEVFRSFQGEGLLLGRRQVFVRLAGCRVGCRYCDTAWAFDAPESVAVPGLRERLRNPLDAAQVKALVDAADPAEDRAPDLADRHGIADRPGRCSVSLTGGEPLEQPDFVDELLDALAPREVMLETSGLHLAALERVASRCRWIACDLKLPSATGLPDVLARHEPVLASGVLDRSETFFKLVADGDTTEAEVAAAAALLARHAPRCPVFLQPVTPLGGSPPLPRARLDGLVDRLAGAGLDVRVVPQVHKVLGVR